MKCIVKKCGACLLSLCLLLCLAGCGEEVPFDQKYDIYQTSEHYGIYAQQDDTQGQSGSFFAEGLAVGGNADILDDSVTEGLSQAAGLFRLDEPQVVYAKNIHGKVYPASTTKIMTACLALKYGDLSATATVSEDALVLEEGSTTCGLSVGDQITLEELLYGLMLCSGNDAANVIAELISGSQEAFAELMNQEAQSIGATNTHFVNPHGLHDENHYTTTYDLYLIFRHALEDERFYGLITTKEHTGSFVNQQGEPITKDWTTSNQYLKGDVPLPEGVTAVGGKTGTTFDAGSCLVLYSEGSGGASYISIVMKADGRENLYAQMTELLELAYGG